MAEAALWDLRYHGIRVVTLAPGAIANRRLPDDEWKLRPRQIGDLMVKLASTPDQALSPMASNRAQGGGAQGCPD